MDETHLSSTGLTPEEFVKQVIQENNVYLETLETKRSGVVQSSPPVVQSSPPEESSSVAGQPVWVETKRYQDSKGKLPLSPVDPDARWQAKNKKERARPAFWRDNLLVDDEGFILAEEVTFSTCSDPQVAEKLIETLPAHPTSLAADNGDPSGKVTRLVRLEHF